MWGTLNENTDKKPWLLSADQWFYVFLFVHVCCWTLIPFIARLNLPMDAIEGAAWGHQLEWGYDKNPYLNAWLTALAVALGKTHATLLIYFFSQLCVGAALWATWKLSKAMVQPAQAFFAVALLEGLQYFNFHAIDFNDNTLELGLWALTIYFFYVALTGKSLQKTAWLLVGFFAGLGMMAKYYTAALLASMFLFMLYSAKDRQQFKTSGPYFAFLVFLSLILPHVVWLFSHDFITVRYVFVRTSSTPDFWNHLTYPLQFFWEQFQVLLPALCIAVLFVFGKRVSFTTSHYNKLFLCFMGAGPLILTLLLSLFTGAKLRAGWGMPLLTLSTLAFVMLVQPSFSPLKLLRFACTTFVFMIILLTIYTLSLVQSTTPSSANFPGATLATTLTKLWQTNYHQPLSIVGGSPWLSGNVAFYSHAHPAVFLNWDRSRSPWITPNNLQQQGALFVWEISNQEVLPPEIQKQFPTLIIGPVFHFKWQRNATLAPIIVGTAFLPPHPRLNAQSRIF